MLLKGSTFLELVRVFEKSVGEGFDEISWFVSHSSKSNIETSTTK